MGAGNAADTAGCQRVLERLAEQGLPDVWFGLDSWTQVFDTEPNRRLLTRKVGTDGRGRDCVSIQLDGGSQRKGLAAAAPVRLVVHQALWMRLVSGREQGPESSPYPIRSMP